MQSNDKNQKDLEMHQNTSKFRYTPIELSVKVPGSDAKVIFDYEENNANLDYWGGVGVIADGLCTNINMGLSDEDTKDMEERRAHFGSNEHKATPPVTYCELIFEGLTDLTLIILIISAAISIALGMYTEGVEHGWHEGAAILFAVAIVLNVTAINDLQKDKQFRELEKRNAQSFSKVLRDGKPKELMVDFIQVGDIVMLTAGDMTPADGLFISGTNAEMDESAMTGEPEMVKKNSRRPFIISGTTMAAGFLTMLVVGVGPHCVHGRMREALSSESEPTPLQLKLEKLATQISKLGTFVASVCFIAMFITHMVEYNQGIGTVDAETGKKKWTSSNYQALLNYFIVAITVLVVAIPEGLPLAVAISLAYSMKKMQNDNILVRHLEACETMGGATTICTDKTGTLTQNKMTVMQAWIETGKDSEQQAHFLSAFKECNDLEYKDFVNNVKSSPKVIQDILKKNSALNANADLVVDDNGTKKVSGSKTEGALLFYCEKLGGDVHEYRKAAKIVQSYPFTSERKRSSVLTWANPGSEEFPSNNPSLLNRKVMRLYVKGASEMILRLCTHILDQNGEKIPLTGDFDMKSSGEVVGEGKKAYIASHIINSMANEALRTIALAYRDFEVDGNINEESKDSEVDWVNRTVFYRDDEKKGAGPCPEVEQDLVLVGIVGIQDPVRPEVPQAVRQCQEAGIYVRMVTGDNINTAIAIAKQCRIYNDSRGGLAIEGPTFRDMIAKNPKSFDNIGHRLQVMARSAPTDKHLLVGCLMERGQVVAVTGDGTNDGPALKLANVGFAMGLSGTEVAKQASDIILLDDNFDSIVKAVSWGRNVYDAIRKFLQFQLTINVVALLIATVGSVSLKESPLKATQMLWVNLIMDSLASLALATEPPTPDLLKRKPYHRNESLISNTMTRNILGQFFYQAIFIITIIYFGETIFEIPIGRQLGVEADPSVQYTIVFHTFVMIQVFNEIASRKVNNEPNILEGIFQNYLFMSIIILTVVIQFLIVQYGGVFISCSGLNAAQHGACVIAGAGGLCVTFLMRYLPPSMFPSLAASFMTKEERDKWRSFNRRNSSPFVLSNSGKVGSSIQNMSVSKKNDDEISANTNVTDQAGFVGNNVNSNRKFENISNSSKLGEKPRSPQQGTSSSKSNVLDP